MYSINALISCFLNADLEIYYYHERGFVMDYVDTTIKTLSMCDQMRLRPSMWGFQVASIEGPLIQIKEVYDNSADEALDPKMTYPIDITFFVAKDKSTYQCLIRDHGRGIPPNKLLLCFTREFTSGKYEGKYGGASTGTNGVGSKASAAFSKVFLAFTKRNDGFAYLKMEKGKVKDDVVRKAIDKDGSTVGTTVFLQPDPEMFSAIGEMFGDPTRGEEQNGFAKHVERMSLYSLFKKNVQVTIRTVKGLLKNSDLDKDPVELWKYLTNLNNFDCEVVFQNELGLNPKEFVRHKFNLGESIWDLPTITKPSLNGDDPLGYDIDVFMDEKSIKGGCEIIGAVNGTPIVHPDSSHIGVLQQVLKDQVINAIDDSEKQVYFENKYRIPISGCISVKWIGAEFIGQDKTRFENRQFEVCYRQFLRKEFKKLGEADPSLWDRLWELIQENFEIEYAKYSRIAYKTGGDLKNLCYDLQRSDSFFNCELKNNDVIKTELFITEGDSAAGRVKSERDAATQAVMKLAGKPKNAIRDDGPKLKANAIFSDMSRILGVNRSDTNLDNMRFGRILILTDADADGYHIVSLLIGMLYKINPLILEEGRVCVTNPPLYSLVHGNKVAYLRDVAALDEAKRIAYRTLFDIDVLVGNTKFHVNKDVNQFRDICLIVEAIGSVVTRYSDLLNIDSMVLEQLVHCVDYLDEGKVNCEGIKKTLTVNDVYWDKDNNVVILSYEQADRSIEYRIPLAKLKKTIVENILPVYERFHWRDFDLFVTTKYSDLYVEEPCSIMMLYDMFQKISHPKYGILKPRRFKGLGEMSAEAITYTCIDPSTRSYTVVKGIGDVDRIFKMLGVDTDERKKLINSGLVTEV